MKTLLLAAFAALLLTGLAPAADLTYTTLPKDTDSELVIAHKVAAAAASGNSFANITTNTTTVVKTGSGVLDRIVIGTAGTSSVITVYDNTAASGTKIGTVSGDAQAVLVFGVRFATGLTIVTTGAPNVTVSYR